MAGKVKLPEENVEYTFKLKNGGVVTYIFVGITDAGRVMLMTTKTKKFTTMTPGYFAYMRKNQLLSQKPTEKYKSKPKKESVLPNPGNINVDEEIVKSCERLRGIEPIICQTILARVGMHPNYIAEELENINSKPEDFFTPAYINRVFGALIKAEEIIREFNVDKVNNYSI